MTDGRPPQPEDVQTAEDLATALAELRALTGGSVREVARAADLPSSTLGGYLAGRHLPPLTRPQAFTALLSVLGVPDDAHPDWLAALHRAHRRRSTATVHEPYRGLEAFDVTDSAVFFGRDSDTAALRGLIDRVPQGLMVVLGASGSGKSSLVRAGLLASLGDDWTQLVIRPGADLVAALDEALGSGIAAAHGERDVIVVIDQFEELWTRSADDRSRESAIVRIIELSERPRHRVLLVARSDFYAQLSAVEGFVDALRHRAHPISSMGPVGLTRVITGPAELVGLTCEPALVDRILRDLSAGGSDLSAVLPHLSHTLRILWEDSDRKRITLADYETIGGVSGAIARSADDAYAGLPAFQRDVAGPLLLRLVVLDEDQVPTAGALQLDARLTEDESEVLEHFARHRLIAIDDLQARFSHEAVLSAWDRLVAWINDAKARLALEQVLDRESRAWQASGQDPGLLLRGIRLQSAQSWAEDPSAQRTPERRAFVEASLEARRLEATAGTRRLRRTRILLAAVSVAAVAALVATGMAVTTSRSRAQERNTALAGQLAAESARFAATDPMVSRELAVAAFRQESTLQTRAAVIGATGTPSITTMTLPLGSPAVAADTKRPFMAIGTVGPTFQLVDVSAATPLVVATPKAPGKEASEGIDAFAWSPAQPLLAVVSSGGAGLIYDVERPGSPDLIGSFEAPTYTGGGLDFSPDGTQLALGTSEDGIHLFHVDRAARTVTAGATLPADRPVTAVTYLPDGRLLSGATGGFITLRDATPEHVVLVTSQLGKGRVVKLRVSGGAAYAATRLENVAYRIPLVGDGLGQWTKVVGFDSWVNDVTVSPDGRFVTFVSADGTARTSDASGQLLRSMTMPDNLVHAAYLADGRLVLGVTTGLVVIRGAWEPAADDPTKKLFASSWSADGTSLVTFVDALGDQTRVWDASDPDNLKVRQILDGVPEGLQIGGVGDLSPDGKLIVAATISGELIGWAMQSDGRWKRTFVSSVGTALIENMKLADDRHVFAVDDDNRAFLADVSGADAVVSREFEGVTSMPLVAAVARGKDLYAAGLDGGETLLWSSGSTAPVATITGEGSVAGVAFSPDAKRLAVVGQSGHLRIYDITRPEAPRLLEDLVAASAGLLSVDFARDGSIAGSVADGSVVIFRPTATGHELLARVPSQAQLFIVRWSPDGKRLAGVGMKATTLTWTVDPAAAADQICRRLGTPMTRDRWTALLPGIDYRKAC